VSHYVRDLMQRPDSFTGVMLEVGSKYSRSGDGFRLDPDTFYRLLLEVPDVRTLHPVRASRDPRNWLNRHLVTRQVDGNVIEVLVYGRRNERVSVSDLQTLRRAAINVVQAEATKTKASVSVVSKWKGALTR
jgi:hypothetical protein